MPDTQPLLRRDDAPRKLPLLLALAFLLPDSSAAWTPGLPGLAPTGLILSEAMADPTAVPDAQGEFLEIGNPGADTLKLDSLRIDADAQSLVLGGLRMAPGEAFLLCRDSLPSANGGMVCGARWAALSLANGRAAQVSLSSAGWRNVFALPASRPGVSWENTWDARESFLVFAASAASWSGGDSATPGFRNSRSALRPERDLGIMDVTWIPAAAAGEGAAAIGDGFLEARVARRGSGAAPASFLSLRLDADWDGEAEILVDSLAVDMPASGVAVLRCGAGSGVRGIVHARLTRDEDPGNDLFLLPVEPGRPLAITEWRPAPAPGEPEWVEIRNRTADSGGIARRLDLSRAGFNGLSLGSKAGILEPGGFLVLTESLERFRARFGSIKARVLQPAGWRSLRNSGDTLVLSLAGLTVDSLVYGAVPAAETREAGTPGFSMDASDAAEAAPAEGWSLSGRVAGPGRTVDVEVRASAGGSYALRVFDLEGNKARDLGSGGPGRRLHSWDGRGEGGRALAPGPYIVCLSRDGDGPRRAVVIVMDAP
jgi:hypothetical protein